MIGDRIKQARKASGFSLRVLAEMAGVTAMAISKYENNQSTPSSGVVINLAKALGVRVDYFFRQMSVELRGVEYRKHSKLPKKVLAQIEGDVLEQVERFLALEEIIPVSPIKPFEIPDGLPDQIKDFDEIEHVVNKVREQWKLGQNPILDFTGTLEERGIKVFQSNALHDGKFDGLACRVNGLPIIVVGADWPGDRQRFTMAHELGHLILEGRLVGDLAENEEKVAHRFAGAFLAPASEVIKELGNRRSWFEPRELCVLKKAYGFSMGGWLHRAQDLSIISDTAYMEMVKMFRKNGWHKLEPCDEYPREEPQVFIQLVFHALAEDFISESKAAELMGKSLVEFRKLRKVDNAQAVTHQ